MQGKVVCGFYKETSSPHVFLGFLPLDSCSICLHDACLLRCPEALLPPRRTRSVSSKWPALALRYSRRRPPAPWYQISSLRFCEPRSGSRTLIIPAADSHTAKLRMYKNSGCMGVERPRTLLLRWRRETEAFLGVGVEAGREHGGQHRDLQYGDMINSSIGVWILGRVKQLGQIKQASC